MLEFVHSSKRSNRSDHERSGFFNTPGHEGLRRWWSDLEEAFADFTMEVEEVTALDEEHFLTVQRFVGSFRFTGISFDERWASVLTVRAGHIVRAVGYLSRGRALKALAGD